MKTFHKIVIGDSRTMTDLNDESVHLVVISALLAVTPISMKPVTYKTKSALQEKIQATIIYYEKEQDGITIEFENLP